MKLTIKNQSKLWRVRKNMFLGLGLTSIFILIVVGYYYFIKPQRYLPNIVLSIGILGTFIGISISLYNFNVNDIEGGIVYFLDGMKTAFVSSVFGMSLSILMKVFIPKQQKIDNYDN